MRRAGARTMNAPFDLAIYKEALLFLATAGVVAPLFFRIRVSPVLGYLLAGVALGPFGLGRLARRAPWLDALASNVTVSCLDTLEEERWPGFAAAALARGVRCCVSLAQRSGERALTLTMFGARPRSLDPDQLPLAELLVAFGGALMGNAAAYDGVQRTVLQLRDSVESSAVLDQARGVLMHARGCTAEEAWQQMRDMSAEQHITMTEVAQQVIASRGADAPEAGAG